MKLALFALLLPALLLTGCSGNGNGGAMDVADEDLRAAVAATFQARCVACHNAAAPAAGLSLVDERMDGALINVWSYVNDQYVLVRPGEPEESFLIKVLRGGSEARGAHMPPNGRLSDSEIDMISRWITSLADSNGQAP
jgi:mono/diheme cytochrome c family protein